MKNKGFTDRIFLLLPVSEYPEHGRIRKFSQKVGITEKLGRTILELGQIPKAETLIKISRAYKKTIDWLLTGESEIMVEKNHLMAAENHAPYEANTINEDNKEKFDLLIKTQAVLNSKTHYAGSLTSNIVSFHCGVEEHHKNIAMEKRLEHIEKAFKNGADPPLSPQGKGGGDGSDPELSEKKAI